MELERKIKIKKELVDDMEILAKKKNITLDIVITKILEYGLSNLANDEKKLIESCKNM